MVVVSTKYGVLFANLEQTDAAEITQRLKAMEVPFSLENGGTTIKVDEKTLNETRLGLASEQLALTKPVGFEIFDDADFGLTEFAQKKLIIKELLRESWRGRLLQINCINRPECTYLFRKSARFKEKN